jgi:hypothetical protein
LRSLGGRCSRKRVQSAAFRAPDAPFLQDFVQGGMG